MTLTACESGVHGSVHSALTKPGSSGADDAACRPLRATIGLRLTHDEGLRRDREQRARLRPEVGAEVRIPVADGIDDDIEQHPLGLVPADDPQRVVDAVASETSSSGV